MQLTQDSASTIFEDFGWDHIHGFFAVECVLITPAVTYVVGIDDDRLMFELRDAADGHDHKIKGLRASLRRPHEFKIGDMTDDALIEILGHIADNANQFEADTAPVSFVQYAVNEFTPLVNDDRGAAILVGVFSAAALTGWNELLLNLFRDGAQEMSEAPDWINAIYQDTRLTVDPDADRVD